MPRGVGPFKVPLAGHRGEEGGEPRLMTRHPKFNNTPPSPLRFGIINSASAIGPWHTGWIVNSKPTGMHIFRGYKRVQGQGFFARYSPVVRADTNGTHG